MVQNIYFGCMWNVCYPKIHPKLSKIQKPKWLLSMKCCSLFISILNYALIYKTWHTMKLRYLLLTVSNCFSYCSSSLRIDGFINCNDCHGALVKSSFYYIFGNDWNFICMLFPFFLLFCQWFDFIPIRWMKWQQQNDILYSVFQLWLQLYCAQCTVHNCGEVRTWLCWFVCDGLLFYLSVVFILLISNEHNRLFQKPTYSRRLNGFIFILFSLVFRFFQRENLRITFYNIAFLVTYLHGGCVRVYVHGAYAL